MAIAKFTTAIPSFKKSFNYFLVTRTAILLF